MRLAHYDEIRKYVWVDVDNWSPEWKKDRDQFDLVGAHSSCPRWYLSLCMLTCPGLVNSKFTATQVISFLGQGSRSPTSIGRTQFRTQQ